MRARDKASAEERDHCERNEVRGEERDHNREREGREKKSADTVKHRDREKDDNGGQRASEHGQRHLLATLLGSDDGRFAQLEMTEDVFEYDDGVVDKPGESKREATQDHAVDGASAELKHKEGRQQRERDREKDRESSPDTAKEDEDHEAGEEEADAALVHQSLDRSLHKS